MQAFAMRLATRGTKISLAFCFMFAAGREASADPTQITNLDNLRVTTSLTVAGLQTAGAKISGTDNSIVLQAKVEKNQGTHYTAQHVSSKITYLGTVSPDTTSSGTFFDDSYTVTTPPPPAFMTAWLARGPAVPDMTVCTQQFDPRQVRMSSNRFQHDTTLTINARVEYDVYDLDEQGMPVKVGHIVHDQVSLTVRVWNRLTRYKILYTKGGTPVRQRSIVDQRTPCVRRNPLCPGWLLLPAQRAPGATQEHDRQSDRHPNRPGGGK